jgi:hypothetical protein
MHTLVQEGEIIVPMAVEDFHEFRVVHCLMCTCKHMHDTNHTFDDARVAVLSTSQIFKSRVGKPCQEIDVEDPAVCLIWTMGDMCATPI